MGRFEMFSDDTVTSVPVTVAGGTLPNNILPSAAILVSPTEIRSKKCGQNLCGLVLPSELLWHFPESASPPPF
jgi:hypothetical protein